MSEKVYTFKGRPLDTLTKEELIDALKRAYDDIERDREFQISAAALDLDLERARVTLRRRAAGW